jgi:hypothetical protein
VEAELKFVLICGRGQELMNVGVVEFFGILAVALDEPTDPAERRRVWETTLAVNLSGVWNTVTR